MKVPDDVVWVDDEDAVRLYHSGTGEFRTLNESAADIWRLLAAGLGEQELVDRLAEEYGAQDRAQRAAIAEDVAEFLRMLGAEGLAT